MLEDSSTKQAARSGHREQSETSELLKSGTLDFAVVQWYSGTVVQWQWWRNSLKTLSVSNTFITVQRRVKRCGDGWPARNVIS